MIILINNYVIHQHNAERAGLHYDFRIECYIPDLNKNMLLSFATRKFPDLIYKNKKRILLLETELHDLYWLNFEGDIPYGYGKGTMKIWDKGTYQLIEGKDLFSEYKKGVFKIILESNQGKFKKLSLSVVRTDKINMSFNYKNKKTWLCIKKDLIV
ncbi:DNA ligase D, 3'-phosphoesterase domain-containing protein [Persephonella hydrogeniphila]|uniref:DNA ligase D, 3'-phosphoesterase domain-containing protein n=1 Tax=Persephonella hydrogeniphila TaxID=198703 RepID=A0A285NCA6_9AQUI|nr:DNA ligase D, 3'-phosphoesterase domain-containing protein [Persephonella hydrogeniphila]